MRALRNENAVDACPLEFYRRGSFDSNSEPGDQSFTQVRIFNGRWKVQHSGLERIEVVPQVQFRRLWQCYLNGPRFEQHVSGRDRSESSIARSSLAGDV